LTIRHGGLYKPFQGRTNHAIPWLSGGRELTIGMKDQLLYHSRHAVFGTLQLRQINALVHHVNAPGRPHQLPRLSKADV
jgi:hypothetical protein